MCAWTVILRNLPVHHQVGEEPKDADVLPAGAGFARNRLVQAQAAVGSGYLLDPVLFRRPAEMSYGLIVIALGLGEPCSPAILDLDPRCRSEVQAHWLLLDIIQQPKADWYGATMSVYGHFEMCGFIRIELEARNIADFAAVVRSGTIR
ncbi:hypothetical protein SBA4_3940010 [Candidatus Sulfopaludibacter sp. SbA4]|nr:hypothetical protein SBA4_3940010 [Candidatus Sulfopaludibacter sp. SbA4]